MPGIPRKPGPGSGCRDPERNRAAVMARWSNTAAAQTWVDAIVRLAPRLTSEQRARISAALASTQPFDQAS